MNKYTFVSFILLMLISSKAIAQKICQQSVVYFDFGKHDLSESETAKIDSILQMPYNEFIIELSGHTDHISSDSFNLDLSNKRVQEVVNYIQNNSAKKIVFKTNSFGRSQPTVPNDTDKNRARNRRVEINVIPLDEGRIVINTKSGAQAKLNIEQFKNIDLCELQFEFDLMEEEQRYDDATTCKYYNKDDSLFSGGFPLDLHTLSFKLNIVGIPDSILTHLCAEFYFPDNHSHALLSIYAYDDRGQLIRNENCKPSRREDNIYHECCFYRNLQMLMLCGGVWPCHEFYLNKNFEQVKYKLDNDDFDSLINNKQVLPFCFVEDTLKVFCETLDSAYYLKLTAEQCRLLPRALVIDSSLFSPVSFNDTTLIIKSRIWGKPKSISLYNEEYQYKKEITRKHGRKYRNAYMEFPHKIAVQLKNGKTVLVDYDQVKKRYNKRRKKLVVKVRRRDLK
jgi:hypothetical protein